MPKFRKKPVEIEAVLYKGPDEDGDPILATHPQGWLEEAFNKDESEEGAVFWDSEGLKVRTLEGVMTANPGDWIIQGVKGEIYFCKPDIFAATYDAV